MNHTERNAAICELYRQGHTLDACGQPYGLKGQRVRQILKKAGAWQPKKVKRDQFLGVNVDEETKQRLRQRAHERGLSVSRLTSDMLKQLLEEERT